LIGIGDPVHGAFYACNDKVCLPNTFVRLM
jgi:hypothetical protein